MPKQKVTSDLLGKWIRPIPAFGNPAGDPLSVDVNKRIWSGIVPDSDGLFRAKIVAVWQEEGSSFALKSTSSSYSWARRQLLRPPKTCSARRRRTLARRSTCGVDFFGVASAAPVATTETKTATRANRMRDIDARSRRDLDQLKTAVN